PSTSLSWKCSTMDGLVSRGIPGSLGDRGRARGLPRKYCVMKWLLPGAASSPRPGGLGCRAPSYTRRSAAGTGHGSAANGGLDGPSPGAETADGPDHWNLAQIPMQSRSL